MNFLSSWRHSSGRSGICTASGELKKFVTVLKSLRDKKASGEISTLKFFEFVAAFKWAVGHLYSQRRIEKIRDGFKIIAQ